MRGIIENVFSRGRNFLENQNHFLNSVRKEHSDNDPRAYTRNHKVNNLERRFLVWTGKYKTVEEVPVHVPQNVMERARNRMRIRIANFMIAGTLVGCGIMVYLGKRAAARGESITQQNLDWHHQYNEDFKKKEEK